MAIDPSDIIFTIRTFLDYNKGDEATEDLILNIGSEILGVSQDMILQMIEEQSRYSMEV